MDKWEYTILYGAMLFRGPERLEKKLDEMGRQGWELVCSIGSSLIFKRRLPA